MSIPVSVIITCYNSEHFIRKTLEKIINQTMQNFEIICIDDCSSDATYTLVCDYAKNDQRIKAIRNQKNMGAAKSRNIGFEQSCGDYIIFLDDDDIYEPNLVEVAYENIKKYDVDILVYRSHGYDEEIQSSINTDWTINTPNIDAYEVFNKNDISRNFFQSFIWWAWDKIFKRTLIENNQIKFQNIPSANDMSFVVKAFLHSEKIIYINDRLITHLFERKNSISSTRAKRYMGSIYALSNVLNAVNEQNSNENYMISFKNYSITYLEWYINTISGDGFFSLFCEIKKFLLSMNISRDDLFEYHIFLAYERLLNLTPLEYLFSLKDRLTHERKIFLEKKS
ncbi:MAG: glycosyltransferase family 2 protein [Acetobacter sp.]|uniref:glycosyltransferase family 2 protein n=2 Tax=Acetobacter sp. TaxID=440 RepID=UPI0039EB3550